MENIQVGEYIRTIDGYIRKVTQVNKKGSYEGLCYGAYSLDKKYKNSVGVSAKKILKHSKNIIDLIEIGDFINGKMCIDIEHYTRDDGSNGIDFVCIGGCVLKENIKTIVTKELFSSVKYEVER